MLQRFSTVWIFGEFEGQLTFRIKFGGFLLHNASVGLGWVSSRPVLDDCYMPIGTEKSWFVWCFIHNVTAKEMLHVAL